MILFLFIQMNEHGARLAISVAVSKQLVSVEIQFISGLNAQVIKCFASSYLVDKKSDNKGRLVKLFSSLLRSCLDITNFHRCHCHCLFIAGLLSCRVAMADNKRHYN